MLTGEKLPGEKGETARGKRRNCPEKKEKLPGEKGETARRKRRNYSEKKTCPSALCPPQIPH